jgi:acyl-coenzyme A thioesterase PaaI-like protein
MDVTKLPFNEFVGLRLSDNVDYLLMLDNKSEYRNHLDTMHASAQFALAEATSGHFLLSEFSELTNVIPVVRKVEVKYKKPVTGEVFSKAKFQGIGKSEAIETLNQKGRVLLNVEVSLFDSDNNPVMQSVFEWFIMIK